MHNNFNKKDILSIYHNLIIECFDGAVELDDFDCNCTDLNEFLKKDSYNQMKEKMNVTYLILYKEDILGFFSLLTDTMKVSKLRKDQRIENIEYNHYPAVKLGRFAIDKKYQGIGLGKLLLEEIISNVYNYSKILGFRFLTVDSYAKSTKFYLKYEFLTIRTEEDKIKNLEKIIKTDPSSTISLFFDLKKVNEENI